MFLTYLRRELRRRRKAALVVASGLALGIALVIVVNSGASGMGKAQDRVLQPLCGLGTDMTVTKAAAPPTSGSGRPRFDFDAQDAGSDKEQSSDRVMVQGFQTLSTATVTKVAGQCGASDAVGGLSLRSSRPAASSRGVNSSRTATAASRTARVACRAASAVVPAARPRRSARSRSPRR